ncbi:hypothetical protein M9Y10_018592 [Tritrichomonas musculus]|uniref:Uncharacterized protein n=1 Tax=Tritrichomonas musculus TaxID=1915356 RepID=A0ABR2HPH1_9EUKA
MEKKSDHKLVLESMIFKIPIKEFEKDIDSVISKEKKLEIIELLGKSNKILTEEEFEEIEEELHEACQKGDIGLIKIYLSKCVQNEKQELTFKINETTKTASLFKVNTNISQLTIPRTIQYESTEYLITSITGTNRDIKTINFVEDSGI